MAMRKMHKASNGCRHATVPDFAELTKRQPEKKLTTNKRRTGGRNNAGRITVRHRGGGHARRYRLIDFKRRKDGVEGLVKAVEYDPNRNARIALIHYLDGEKAYILWPKGLQVGARIVSSDSAVDPEIGNCMPLNRIPQGSSIHNVELQPGRGGQLARSAGSAVRLMAIDGKHAIIEMPSGELRRVPAACRGTIGEVGNSEFSLRSYGKAGRMRWLGRRPHVRGNAQNPVAHPLGGGEGHSNGGRQHCSPTGVLAKGFKTRKGKKPSDKMIIRRRKTKKKG